MSECDCNPPVNVFNNVCGRCLLPLPDDEPSQKVEGEPEWGTHHTPFAVENITIDQRHVFEKEITSLKSQLEQAKREAHNVSRIGDEYAANLKEQLSQAQAERDDAKVLAMKRIDAARDERDKAQAEAAKYKAALESILNNHAISATKALAQIREALIEPQPPSCP